MVQVLYDSDTHLLVYGPCQGPTSKMCPKLQLKKTKVRLYVLAITKAARDILCAVHYQQDGAYMALVPSI